MPYDLFLGVPVHRAPTVVHESGLCVDGWIPVDPRTLETSFPDVYAVGDVTSVGTPKAGVFSEGQAAVVASQIISRVRTDSEPATYDGHGTCYLEFGSRHGGPGQRHLPERAGSRRRYRRSFRGDRQRQGDLRDKPHSALVRPGRGRWPSELSRLTGDSTPGAGAASQGRGPFRLGETDRLEGFSDGVMAVIITIMAFNIKPPTGTSITAAAWILPQLLVYVLSFAVIGIYWNNHHHLLPATERINGGVMWANLFLLLWLSLFPIVTAWVGRFPLHSLPAAMYGSVGLGSALGYWILVRTIIWANGAESTVAHAIGSDYKGKISLGFYAVGIGVAFLAPVASYVLYVAVAVTWFIPDRRLARSQSAAVVHDR